MKHHARPERKAKRSDADSTSTSVAARVAERFGVEEREIWSVLEDGWVGDPFVGAGDFDAEGVLWLWTLSALVIAREEGVEAGEVGLCAR